MSELVWDSEPYVTAYTFRKHCQHALFTEYDSPEVKAYGNAIDPMAVRTGDRIFVVTELLGYFLQHIHPHIPNPYYLVTGRSDIQIDDKIANAVLNDYKILHWYATNCSSTHIRITSIPLGLDNKTWMSNQGYPYNGRADTSIIEDVNSREYEKEADFLISFRFETNNTERSLCYEVTKNLPNTTTKFFKEEDSYSKETMTDFYETVKKHKFVLCPWGNGIDCHRNWQTWHLDGIPVIKRHPVLDYCKNLRAWWIDDWEELLHTDVNEKYEELSSQESDTSILWFDYWKKRMSIL